jgi:hypothetical protein
MSKSHQTSMIQNTLTILALIMTISWTRADANPIKIIKTETIVHVLAQTDSHPLSAFVESDYVSSPGITNQQANAASQREAIQGNDNFTEALLYLRQSPRAAALLNRLDHDGIRISIVVNHECNGGQRMIEEMNSLVNWDPHCAYHTGKSSNSPALVLLHELVHTIHLAEHPQAYLDNTILKNRHFDTNEERVTIVYGEIPVARELGEAIRTDHHENRPFRVNDPTLR